jgi:cytoskeletal protein CcmA (bactofilin family)
MFGSKENNNGATAPAAAGKPNAPSSPAGANVLVKGTTIEGKIVSEGDIRIDGIVRGSIDCKAKIVIGPTGVIDGDITCQNALIEGKFDGKLIVKEMLSLRGTAQVTGDVSTQKLVVEAGALFNVNCKMGAPK